MLKTNSWLYKNYSSQDSKEISIEGWVKNIRVGKNIIFLSLSDGTSFNKIQVVCKNTLKNFENIKSLTIASAVKINGKVLLTPGKQQPFEISASNIDILSVAINSYPLQNKEHSSEFLREIAHLRKRSNTFEAIFRIRNVVSFAIHEFFQNNEFIYVHSPILTGNDCEGAGETFVVNVDNDKNFFNKTAKLSVSGQLAGEAFAMGFKNIYTFGPTFRAEKSNTTRHLAEFWMIEPEMAFADLQEVIKVSYECLKYLIKKVLEKCSDELLFLETISESGKLIDRLNNFVTNDYKIIHYKEAIEILKEAIKNGIKFENNKIEFGLDLATEHERYLCENHFKMPIYVINYPASFKAFYMKLNDDNKTVASFDLLMPGIGELIGGSQRESDYNKLLNKIKELKIDPSSLEWYLNLRNYGYYQSSGFGLGLERLIMYITGRNNIRDVIPFPRAYKYLDF